jgi:Protein of unknown function (DUF3618)
MITPREPARSLEPVKPMYGWTDEGKTPAEIEVDIQQTRYRLDADLRELKEKVQPKRLVKRIAKAKWPAAAIAALAAVIVLIRRARR